MKTLGIDPGTKNYSFFLLDDNKGNKEDKEKENKEIVIPTDKINNNPGYVLKIIKKFMPDAVSAPSGYGLAPKKVVDLSEKDFYIVSLKKAKSSSIGVRKILKLLIENKVNSYVLPSVKHLPTVEEYKKINKIDMGTPDKVSSTVYVLSQYENYKKASFLLAEIGSAFNAFIEVKNGRIVDGIGGSNASSGFISGGGIDAEIFYLNRKKENKFKKNKFSGGVVSIIGKDVKPETFFKNPEKYKDGSIAYNFFITGIIKDISMFSPDKVIISGRTSKYVYREIQKKFNTELTETKKASTASIGAAIAVNGLYGGRFKGLIKWMKLDKASGDLFDYIYI